MTSKERVHAALRRGPTDRVPIFMWFHPDTAVRLGAALEIPPGRVAEALGDDVRQTWVNHNHAMEGVTHEREGEGHVDCWGVEWVRVGPFNQIRRSPLQGAGEAAVRSYVYPYDHVEDLLGNMGPVLASSKEYFVGCDVSPCVFEMACRLRGMEDALLDVASDPALGDHLLAQAGVFAAHLAGVACARFPLDWLWTGDDVGGQLALIMSPATWRERVRPHLARVVAEGRRRGLWVAYHCCGALRPIIPDLIEMGVNVLNPIQSNCPGMDPGGLKADFGRDLAFMGGVDTQETLPFGTAAEVGRYTSRLIEGMTSDGGGYILAASHTIPPETPLENIFAMYDAAGVRQEEIWDRASDIRSQGHDIT